LISSRLSYENSKLDKSAGTMVARGSRHGGGDVPIFFLKGNIIFSQQKTKNLSHFAENKTKIFHEDWGCYTPEAPLLDQATTELVFLEFHMIVDNLFGCKLSRIEKQNSLEFVSTKQHKLA